RLQAPSQTQIIRNGDSGLTDLIQPNSLALSPDGSSLYVTSPFKHSLIEFSRGSDGRLTHLATLNRSINGLPNLEEPRSIVATPDGSLVYVSCAHALLAFTRDAAAGGRLSFGGIVDGQLASPFGSDQPARDGCLSGSMTISRDGTKLMIA